MKIFEWLNKFGNIVRNFRIIQAILSIKNYLQEKVIMRKFVVFMLLFSSWFVLVVAGLLSKDRQIYSQEMLNTEQNFSNGTGSIKLVSQIFSKENGLILLNFETKSQRGDSINPKNLKWKLYSSDKGNAEMEVVPILDNKITVIIRNVPKNFDAYAVDIKNTSANADEISVDISSSSSSDSSVKNGNQNNQKSLQFIITSRGKGLKNKHIKDIGRKDLIANEVDKEIEFQKNQRKKLTKAIKDIRKLIQDNEDKIEEIQNNETYLTDDQKQRSNDEINSLRSSNETYYNSIEEAKKNIKLVSKRITMLEKKKQDVEHGRFHFSNAIEVKEK